MKTRLMKNTLVALALGGLGLMATGAQAAHRGGDYDQARHGRDHGAAFKQSQQFRQQIDARQDRQMERIQAGRRSGSVTPAEFRELMRDQRELRAMERNFLADGILDPREFKRLDRALDRASHDIRLEKRDHQARGSSGRSPRYN
jgi:hypothetical protein